MAEEVKKRKRSLAAALGVTPAVAKQLAANAAADGKSKDGKTITT